MSYLLTGLYLKRETAIFANIKAFLANRIGDFGFIVSIADVAMYFGNLDYKEMFTAAPEFADTQIVLWSYMGFSLITVTYALLFTWYDR